MKKGNVLFHNYFYNWIQIYKDGAVSDYTLDKYYLTYRHLKRIAPDLRIRGLSRLSYQQIINEFAITHERSTTMDFHHHLKASLADAFDEGLIDRDPTRRVVIKGCKPKNKKHKYLSEFELKKLLRCLELGSDPSLDWLILVIAKTGLRFSEALGLTKNDLDFENQVINISKTWDYKSASGGFKPTKNKSSIRKVPIDWKLSMQLNTLIKDLPENQLIFSRHKRVFNSTINNLLKRKCIDAGIPVISVHGLRHTHASLLLFAGVSTASVAKRLGHADITTTQQTYLHIIQELENQDNSRIMQHLASL